MIKLWWLLLLCLVCVCGCTIPGTYLDFNDVQSRTYKVGGQVFYTTIIPLNDSTFRLNKTPNAYYEYHIGPYDILNIVVWHHPEFSLATPTTPIANDDNYLLPSQMTGENAINVKMQMPSQETGFFVDSHGEITFPFLGNIKVSGLTVPEARRLLQQKLKKYVYYPIVSVKVITFNSQRIHVLGEVVNPGIKPLGDRPLTILDALGLSGGINTNTADPKHIYVIRKNDSNNIIVYMLNSKSPRALVLAEQFRLTNNDIVYVAPAGIASWNRVVNQVLPSLQTLWYTRSLIRD